MALLWVLSAALMLLGLAGTVLPVLPGTALVLAGIVLAAWIDDFSRVGAGTLAVVAVLAVRRVGARLRGRAAGREEGRRERACDRRRCDRHDGRVADGHRRRAFHAARRRRDRRIHCASRRTTRDASVGVATWIGIMLGMIAKVVIAFMMIGIFIVALLF